MIFDFTLIEISLAFISLVALFFSFHQIRLRRADVKSLKAALARDATPSNTFAQGGSDTSDIGAGAIVQLQFSESEGDYSFDIGGESFTVATASAGDSLQEAIGATRDAINANTTINGDVTARVVDGRLELENTSAACSDT